MSFVIRSRGFFFTDEYMSPIEGTFKPVKGARYDTRAEAEAALAVHNRKVLRTERLCDYVFDDRQGIGAVTAYLQTTWPDRYPDGVLPYDFALPPDATDAQLDELLRLSKVTFAEVFEVEGEPKAERWPEEIHFPDGRPPWGFDDEDDVEDDEA